MKIQLTSKRLQIDKANSTIIAVLIAASVITSFSLVTVSTMFDAYKYHRKVITQKEAALSLVQSNVQALTSLRLQYQTFDQAPENIIKGSAVGSDQRSGTNSKIILDALPSKYDFPALNASLESIVKNAGTVLENITGVDLETQEANKKSSNPQPIEVPYGLTAAGNYDSISRLVNDLELSIRPFHTLTLDLSGADAALRVQLSGKTYYQPERDLNITKELVK